MQIAKLFGVLVVGGALLACDGDEAEEPQPDGSAQLASQDSGTEGDDAGDEPAGEELIDCGFCPNEMCCETADDGSSQVKDGFECCWATTC